MKLIADLHIHSRFSLATSPDLNLETLSRSAKQKGIQLLGTGDMTHPVWSRELESQLQPVAEGIFEYNQVNFILSVEVSQVYRQDGKVRRIHNLVYAPGFRELKLLNKQLSKYGKLGSDGRPTLSLPGNELVKICKDISARIEIIPAHAWTPWYAVFGSKSGFNRLEECFGEYAKYIRAIETGLSSDPAMNWRCSWLDTISLISNSDAHSPVKLGREANCLNIPLSYDALFSAIYQRQPEQFTGTIEFYPEEGKYHYDGHRNCGICYSPEESRRHNNNCPVCGKPLTLGVLHRVESLSDRPVGYTPAKRIPFRRLVCLMELIALSLQKKTTSPVVSRLYQKLIQSYGNEFDILLELDASSMDGMTAELKQLILQNRAGEFQCSPGYDGEFGSIIS